MSEGVADCKGGREARARSGRSGGGL